MEIVDNLKETPLCSQHKKLGAKMSGFGGWLMPIQYEGIIAEHNWTRSQVSLFDICHMGQFIIEGDPEKNNLNKILTFDLNSIKADSCRYSFMLNERGGVIDDLVVYKIKDNKFMIVVNAATTDKDYNHIKKNLTGDFKFENISPKTGKLDIQGPKSKDVLEQIVGKDILKLEYYTFNYFELLGEKCIISRTGYTGELGFEIYITRNKVIDLWNLLLENKLVKPAGLGARDTLRLEMGYSLYGQDIDETVAPLEAGLENFIDFNNDFIGKSALLKKKDNLERRRIFFQTDSRRAPRHNYKIYSSDNQEIGVVTSGSFSPSLSCGIGMGFIKNGFTKLGTPIILREGSIELAASIVKRPFYKKGTFKEAI